MYISEGDLKMTLLSDQVFSFSKDISNLSSQHENCTLALICKGCVIATGNLALIWLDKEITVRPENKNSSFLEE